MVEVMVSLGLMTLIATIWVSYPWVARLGQALLLAVIAVISIVGMYYYWGGFFLLSHYQERERNRIKVAAILQKKQGVDEIISALKARIKANPTVAQGWYLLGRLYATKNQWQAANQAFNKAHLLSPDEEGITVNYLNSLWQLQQHQFSPLLREGFEALLDKNAQQPDALAMLALDAYQQKKWDKAIAFWQRLLMLAPEHSEEAQALQQAINKARHRGELNGV